MYPDGIYIPGDINKRYNVDNNTIGIVMHSMEGYIDYALEMIQDADIRLSWHFSIDGQGNVYQHYLPTDSCFCNGNYWANTNYIGIEHEGIAGQPLTTAQLTASIKLVHWLANLCKFPVIPGKTLLLHKDVVQLQYPNAGPTNCPSGRIPLDVYVKDYDVKVTNLDQSQSIQFVQKLVANVNDIITDSNGCTVLQLETPSIPLTPGYKLYGVVVKE